MEYLVVWVQEFDDTGLDIISYHRPTKTFLPLAKTESHETNVDIHGNSIVYQAEVVRDGEISVGEYGIFYTRAPRLRWTVHNL